MTSIPNSEPSVDANSSRSAMTCLVSTDGPIDDSVRERRVTIRSAIGFWTTRVFTKDDSGLVARRLWCGSKSTTGDGFRRHPEAAERAPLVLGHPPGAGLLARQPVREGADLVGALAQRQRVEEALAEAGVGDPGLAVDRHQEDHVVDRALAADDRLVVGDLEPAGAQEPREHGVELEAVAAAAGQRPATRAAGSRADPSPPAAPRGPRRARSPGRRGAACAGRRRRRAGIERSPIRESSASITGRAG